MTHDEFRATRHFAGLDGLRAIAAVMVVAFHYGGPKWSWLSGWSGVHVFFVLSGFLITTLALREEERRGRLDILNFYIRRFFRIVPVYLVVVGLLVAHICWTSRYRGSPLAADMPYLLTFRNEDAPHQYFTPSWTLGIEQKFYLVWPLVAFAVGAMAFARRLAVTLGVIAFGLALFVIRPIPTAHYIVILAGCLLAVVMHARRGYAVLRPLTHPLAGIAVAAAFVGAQVGLRPLHTVVDQSVGIMLYSVCVAVLLPAVLSPGPVRWLLSLSPLRFVGERSYALYLLQLLVCWVLLSIVRIPPGNRLFLLVTVTALLVADVLLRTVERPMIEVGRRLTALRGGRGVDPAAGAAADRAVSGVPVPVVDGAAAILHEPQRQDGPHAPASGGRIE